MKSALQLYRKRIIKNLSSEGLTQTQIASSLEMSQGRVSQILQELSHSNGEIPIPAYKGRSCNLTEVQKKDLCKTLDAGAELSGFEGQYWTSDRIQSVIEETYQVHYHTHHIPKLMKKLGYSWQKPETVDDRQDPAKLKEWREVTLPALKKSPRRR